MTGYISKCIDDGTVSRTIILHPNQKPGMTAEVHALLKTCDSAFKSGDKVALREDRSKLIRAIRDAKCAHSQRIHTDFNPTGDPLTHVAGDPSCHQLKGNLVT